MIPIIINMIRIIQINRKSAISSAEENQNNKLIVKRSIKRVVLLYVTLIVLMFLSFFLNYIFAGEN